MKSLMTTLAIATLFVTPAHGDIKHYSATGQTMYARVQTGTTTFVACALSEGSSGGAGVYTATDAALVTAGLTTPSLSGHTFTIRSGSPSTTANDPIIGYGQLAWDGSTEVPIAANLMHAGGTEIGSTGTSNFRAFFTEGYGPLLLRTSIVAVDSPTVFTIAGPFGDSDSSANGCSVVIYNDTGDHKAVRTITSNVDAGGNTTITIDSSVAGFGLDVGAIVEILPPGFGSADRSKVNATNTRVTTALPNASAGTSDGLFIAGTNAATSITGGLTANITGSLSGSVGSVTGNVGGNVVGSVGSISGVTFPANFSGLTISSGRVNADVTYWLGAQAVEPTVPGVPVVDITHVLGSPVCH